MIQESLIIRIRNPITQGFIPFKSAIGKRTEAKIATVAVLGIKSLRSIVLTESSGTKI